MLVNRDKLWPEHILNRVTNVRALKDEELHPLPDCFLCTGYSTHEVEVDGRKERICKDHFAGLKRK